MLRHYLKQALRNFWRFRLTTAVNIAGLALGLVCFVATYVYLQSLLNSDTQYPKAPRIYVLTQELWTPEGERFVAAYPTAGAPAAKYLKADFPALDAVARALPLGSWAAAAEERKIDVFVAAVDPDFLRIFDLPFISGDPATALASARDVVITESAAKRLFGTGDAVGRRMLLQNKTEVTVSGVIGPLPTPSHLTDGPRSDAPVRFEVLVPMDLLRAMPTSAGIGIPIDPDGEQWGADIFFTYALLPANGSLTAAEFTSGLRTFGDRRAPSARFWVRSVFGAVPISRIALSFLDALVLGGGSLAITTTVFLLDALILVIACVNYANLAVAIATTRAKEIGMRKVLGAGRLQLMGQYLFEAVLLGTAAFLIVVVGTVLAIPPLNRALGTTLELPSLADPHVWLMVVVILSGVSLVGGAYPALVLARVAPVESLRAGTIRTGPKFVPTLLVGIQFAAASFLLVVALLMANQNRVMQRGGIRADRDPVVAIANDTTQLGIDFDTLRSELLRDSHIKSVTAAANMPWSSGGSHATTQRKPDSSTSPQMTLVNQVSYDFFPTLGINLLAGRSFDRNHGDEAVFGTRPANSSAINNVIIDRSLARQLGWPNPKDAVGQLLYRPGAPGGTAAAPAGRIIGVVENGYPRLVGPHTSSNLYLLDPVGASVPVIRVARDGIQAALAHLDEVWARLAPNAPLRRQFMDDLFIRAYESFATISRVVAGLAAFAFAIAIMGLFGMAIHVTSRRRREIGIRKTLGASARRVVLMLLRDFARPVVVANVIAWPLAFLAGRVYLNLFTERAALSLWPFVLGLTITVAIAWVAVGGQALRAAAVKPAKVLHLD